jgi:hypothetical protein
MIHVCIPNPNFTLHYSFRYALCKVFNSAIRLSMVDLVFGIYVYLEKIHSVQFQKNGLSDKSASEPEIVSKGYSREDHPRGAAWVVL